MKTSLPRIAVLTLIVVLYGTANLAMAQRVNVFADDFEGHSSLYGTINAGWTVVSGSGSSEGTWRLWNTAGNPLGTESAGLAGMSGNYAISDSDLPGNVLLDEQLITPAIDCRACSNVRLDFSRNYRVYDDVGHDQVAEVDIRSSNDGGTWSQWVNLQHYDRAGGSSSGSEQVDISAYADGKVIQIRWHFYDTYYDYWFAVDNIVVSGRRVALSGRVYEGPTGSEPPTAKPIKGVTVTLYGSQQAGVDDPTKIVLTFLRETTTDQQNGWYGLEVYPSDAFDYFNIIETNKGTYVDSDPPGATADPMGGEVKSPNWIQYGYGDIFVFGKTLTGNKFWDKKEGQSENHPPVANPDPTSTWQDTPVTISVLANDTDPDGDPLTIQSVTDPPHGSTVNNGNSVTYTPDSGYTGSDSFTYAVSDDKGAMAIGTVTIYVSAAPVQDEWDFGDAPDDPQKGYYYPTTQAHNGAANRVSPNVPDRIRLGANVDTEADGQPDLKALGDDNNGDDETGVNFLTPLIRGKTGQIEMTIQGKGNPVFWGGWIDWNADGDWNDAGEQVIDNSQQPVSLQSGTLYIKPTVSVPPNAKLGPTYARFRVQEGVPPQPTGASLEYGEVEDYAIVIGSDGPYPSWVTKEYDYGDAPTTNELPGLPKSYPEASHQLGGPYLGMPGDEPDPELGMQPHAQALGDNIHGYDDENALFDVHLYQGQMSHLSLYVQDNTGPFIEFTVAAWIDLNADGDWDDPGELVRHTDFYGGPTGGGMPSTSNLQFDFPLPATAKVGWTFARFRIYEGLEAVNPSISPSGPAGPGEVEDYLVEIKAGGSGLPPSVALPPTGGVAPGGVLPPMPTLPPGYCIWGYKYNDLNGSHAWDLGEKPVANWPVWLDTNNDGQADTFTSTDSSGVFIFAGLQLGTYTVGEQPQVGWTQTYPTSGTYSVEIKSNQNQNQFQFPGILFGNQQTGGPGPGEGERWQYLKWSQPVVEIDPKVGQTPVFCGWDEPAFSVQTSAQQRRWNMVADDFHCLGPIPVTSVRWWGSFAGWTDRTPPLVAPTAFHIGIWTGVPPDTAYPWGRPEKLVWETTADDWTWEFAGYEQSASGPGTSVPSTGLVAHWKLDGDATDSAGTSHGTVRGNPVWATGKVDRALRLDGVDDYVDCGNKAALNLTSRITVAAWVNITAVPSDHRAVISKGDSAWRISTLQSQRKFHFAVGGAPDWPAADGSQEVAAGQWHHVAGTYDGAAIRLYVDGVLDGTRAYSGSIGVNTQPVFIGENAQETGRGWNGLIDDVLVYNRALSADEIKSLVAPPQQQTQEACFEFNHDLPTADWFHQERFQTQQEVFWISITAMYPGSSEGTNPWGWMGRPAGWNNGAVRFERTEAQLQPGLVLAPQGMTLVHDEGACGTVQDYDMAFELRTDPPWIRWDEPFTGMRDWPSYDDHASWATEATDGTLTVVERVADDWAGASREAPLIALAWEGSYIGYGYEACQCGPTVAPRRPNYFQVVIWANLPPDAANPLDRPGDVLWAYEVFDYDEVLVGYDRHPGGEPNEPVFRYSARLPRDQWFWHEGERVYWLSIVAVYVGRADQIKYPWGWTDHKHQFGSAASKLSVGGRGLVPEPLSDPTGGLIDMSFTLYTTSESRPIAYWRFDETQGAIAVDSVGGHDGAVHGATWTTGAAGGALHFAGGDYVEVSDEADFDLTKAISVAAWVNLEAVNADWIGIVTKGDSTWRLSTLQAQKRFHFAVNDPQGAFHAVDGTTRVGLNEWHQVVGTYDGSSLRLYVDGVEDPGGPVSHTGPIHADDFLVWIGANSERPGRGFVGRIDEVLVYDRSLTQTEILELVTLVDDTTPRGAIPGR
jgi:hypothetical protein